MVVEVDWHRGHYKYPSQHHHWVAADLAVDHGRHSSHTSSQGSTSHRKMCITINCVGTVFPICKKAMRMGLHFLLSLIFKS